MDSGSIGAERPRSKWPTRLGLSFAALLGGLLYLYFFGLFVNLWIRTGSFSLIQIMLYFGMPALELLALIFVLFMARRNGGLMVSNLLMTVWLANILNMVLGATGIFGF